ncbi:MAG: TonB-dependent siderophore receptor [Opitutaceae bacterium]
MVRGRRRLVPRGAVVPHGRLAPHHDRRPPAQRAHRDPDLRQPRRLHNVQRRSRLALERGALRTLYANVNSSFVPVFLRQPDGTPLDPEQGNQKELGLRFSLARDRVQGLVSVYEIRQQNLAVDDPNRDGDWYTQIDGVRSRGVEFSLNVRFTEAWSLMGGYAYNDARDTRTNARSMYAPHHMATAFNKYAFRSGVLRGLDLALGSIFVGDRPIDPVVLTTLGGIANTPTWTMPGKWRFDGVIRYAVPRAGRVRYVLGAKVQNVLDNQEIYKLGDSNSVQRQPGRTFQASLSAKF